MVWRYAAASTAGSSHIASGAPCQDAFRCAVMPDAGGNSVLILAVSDGAGSAHHGEKGAALACTVLVEQATGWLAEGHAISELRREDAALWLDGIRERIACEAAGAALPARSYAATLLFALVSPEHSAFGQIGDGALVTSDAAGEWSPMLWPQRGGYANETYFVTDDGAHERLRLTHGRHPVREVALFTDGLERLLLNYAEHSVHSPAFERMFQPLRVSEGSGEVTELSAALRIYLASPMVACRTDDDATLVLATRVPAPAVSC